MSSPVPVVSPVICLETSVDQIGTTLEAEEHRA